MFRQCMRFLCLQQNAAPLVNSTCGLTRRICCLFRDLAFFVGHTNWGQTSHCHLQTRRNRRCRNWVAFWPQLSSLHLVADCEDCGMSLLWCEKSHNPQSCQRKYILWPSRGTTPSHHLKQKPLIKCRSSETTQSGFSLQEMTKGTVNTYC